MKREIGWIFQDYPILFLEMSFMGNKELQLWNTKTVTHIYSIQFDDFHLRYLDVKNWIYWCHVGQGKGQLTYGSVVDLMEEKLYERKVIEDHDSTEEENEDLYLSYISYNTLIFSKSGGLEMKIFGLKAKDFNNHDDLL